jgi:TonB family protein
MNSTYSLAYSRAGFGGHYVSARRDLVIAVIVALGACGVLIGSGWFMQHAVLRTPPETVLRTVDMSVAPVFEDVPATDAGGGEPSPAIAPPQRHSFVPDPAVSPWVQPFQTPIVTVPSPTMTRIVVAPGISGPGGPGINPGQVFEPGELDRTPTPVYQVQPQYPQRLRVMGLSGRAVVDFVVDRHGIVRDAAVASASDPEFGAAAVAGVSQWKFKPGVKDGRAVAVHMRVPIVFSVGGE